jgi:hypothetical protein
MRALTLSALALLTIVTIGATSAQAAHAANAPAANAPAANAPAANAPAANAPAANAPAANAPASNAPASNAPAAGEQCDSESYRWNGSADLDGRATEVRTGVEVPATTGTRLEVVGVSADGIGADGIAHALPVRVGGVDAVAGATVPGGLITVVVPDNGPMQLAGVTVVVQRCAQVSSFAPEVEVPGLPRTGIDELRQTVIGAAIIAVGVSLVMLGRRRVAR